MGKPHPTTPVSVPVVVPPLRPPPGEAERPHPSPAAFHGRETCLISGGKYSNRLMVHDFGRAESVEECQVHCRQTEGCAYFSYWIDGKYCSMHREGATLLKNYYAREYVSGTPHCSREDFARTCWVPSPESKCGSRPWTHCAFGNAKIPWCLPDKGPRENCIDRCKKIAVVQLKGSGALSSIFPNWLLFVFFGILVVGCLLLTFLWVLKTGGSKRPNGGMRRISPQTTGTVGITGPTIMTEYEQVSGGRPFQASLRSDNKVVLQRTAGQTPSSSYTPTPGGARGMTLYVQAPSIGMAPTMPSMQPMPSAISEPR